MDGRDQLLCAFGRFIHTRGFPATVYSYNETYFVGAERDLAEAASRIDLHLVQRTAEARHPL